MHVWWVAFSTHPFSWLECTDIGEFPHTAGSFLLLSCLQVDPSELHWGAVQEGNMGLEHLQSVHSTCCWSRWTMKGEWSLRPASPASSLSFSPCLELSVEDPAVTVCAVDAGWNCAHVFWKMGSRGRFKLANEVLKNSKWEYCRGDQVDASWFAIKEDPPRGGGFSQEKPALWPFGKV